jgi:hypothetical protein
MRKNTTPLTDEQRELRAIEHEKKKVAQLTSPEDAAKLIAEMIREYALDIKGMKPHARERLTEELNAEKLPTYWSIEWDHAFTVGCTLYVRLDHDDVDSGKMYTILTFKPVVEVNWSGTGRSPAAALASIALYREVSELAALIEARLSEIRTIGSARLLTDTRQIVGESTET